MHRDGFGFVIPEATSLDASLKARLAGDVFIPPHATGSSMHGDRVLVEVTAFRTDGRAEGRIVRSLSRAHPTVVGIFHYGHRHNYRQAHRRKSNAGNRNPAGMEIPNVAPPSSAAVAGASRRPRAQADGKPPAPSGKSLLRARSQSNSRDRVIGEEAAVHTDWQDLDGVVVDVEITDWPSATQNRAAASSKFSAKKTTSESMSKS